METFYVSVTETLNRIVEVSADSADEAVMKAEQAYQDEDIILDYNDFVDVTIEDATESTSEMYGEGCYKPEFQKIF